MVNVCKIGDKREHSFKVKQKHFPDFNGKVIHRVCSTYVLAREIEWSSRLFVIDMLEEDEEGIGTMINIEHVSPAFGDETILIEATIESLKGRELRCTIIAKVGERVIAKGKTGQKILKKKELEGILGNEGS
jgi:predicted thioesterase